MIRHVVYVRPQDGVTSAVLEAAFAEGVTLLRQIEGVQKATLYPLLTSTRHRFTHALVAEIDTRAHLEAYTTHPLHLEMAKTTKPLMAEALVADIEEGAG